jgi:UDP-N-acetyl-D-glucosamine dehydrogenase
VQRTLGQSFRFVELANDINNHMPDYVIRRLVAALNERRKAVNGSTVLLLGLAYKRNSGDARESPARRVASLLLDMGAEVRAADPHVVEDARVDRRVVRVALTEEQIAAADAVILLADHDAFDLDLVVRHAQYVLDTRHRLTGPAVESL